MSTKRTYYMHTLDDKPAVFHARDRAIYYANGAVRTSQMAKSIREMRVQQGHDIARYHVKEIDPRFRRGYIRVVVDV